MAKIKFKSFSDPQRENRVPSSAGSHISFEKREKVVDGHKQLVVTGKYDVNEFIQRSLPDTLLYNLMDRYGGTQQFMNMQGNVNFIDQLNDFTHMPNSLAEAQQIMIDAQDRFERLPMQIRSKFENNVDLFLKSISDGSAVKQVSDILVEQGFYDRTGQYIRRDRSVNPSKTIQNEKIKKSNEGDVNQ